MPDQTPVFRLEPTGDTVLIPAPQMPHGAGLRLVLDGIFRFRYTDEIFDAVYKFTATGERVRHSYLQWKPQAPVLESEDPVRHRYVYRFPPEWNWSGQTVGVR